MPQLRVLPRRGRLRNEAVAPGNWGLPDVVPVLAAAFEEMSAATRPG